MSTDLFTQEGITFESSHMASTAPNSSPPAIEAPHINMNRAPGNSSPGPMSQDDKNAAIKDLYGNADDQATAAAPAAAASAPDAPTQPISRPQGNGVDLLAQEGLATPSVTEQNQNAMTNGIPLAAPHETITSPPGKGEMSQVDFGTKPTDAQRAADQAEKDRNSMIQLGIQRYGTAKVQEWLAQPRGMSDALELAVQQGVTLPFVGDAQRLATSEQIQALGEKQTRGEPFTAADIQTANSYLDNQIEQSIRGFTRGGKVAYSMSQIPAWLYEFALADGAGKVFGAGAKAAAAGTPEALAATAAAVARTATTSAFMPGQYAPAYAERRVNAITGITDKGELVFHSATESPAMSALAAYGYTAADVASALAGPGIDKYIVEPGTKMLTTPITAAAQALPVNLRQALYDTYKTIDPNASYSKIMTPAGWNSMLSALGAFQVDKILRSTIDYGTSDKMTVSDALRAMPLNEDDLLVAGGLAAIHGGISTAGRITSSILQRRGVDPATATETSANMSAMEKEAFVAQHIETPSSPIPKLQDEESNLTDIEKAGFIAKYQANIDGLRASINPTEGAKKPLLGMIKELGGVKTGSQIAGELNSMGINTKTAPGLFRNDSGAGDLDNIPLSEWNARFGDNAQGDGNGYVDRNYILHLLGKEAAGERIGGKAAPAIDQHFVDMLQNAGIDPKTATGEQIFKAFGPSPEVKMEAQRMGATISDRDAIDIANMLQINPHMDIDHAIEQHIERQGIVEHADTAAPMRAILYDAIKHPDPMEQLAAGQTNAVAAASPPPIAPKQSGFNSGWKNFKDTHLTDIYAELVNDLQPIENLSKTAKAEGAKIEKGSDTALLTSFTRSTPEWIRRNQLLNTTTWDKDGNQVITGKGLKVIYDDFDNAFLKTEPSMKQRHEDLENFLVAQRLLEESQSGRNVLVTPDQLKKSTDDLANLANKYGQDFALFDTFAKEIRDWDNRILHNLVTSGLRTQEWFDHTTKQRKAYSPLNRVVQDEFDQSAVTRSGLGSRASDRNIGSLKQFKGSDKEIKNTFQSRLKNSALIMQKSAVNKLKADIAKFANFYPEEIKVQNPAILREPAMHSYDPKLREKLEHMVDFLNGNIARGKGKDLGLKSNTLGSYSPAENLIRMRIGTTEGTLAHEAGHMLDEQIGLKARLLKDPEIKAELQKLAEDRIGSTHELITDKNGTHFEEEVNISPKKYLDYIKNDDEVIANMFDASVNSPEQFAKTAPKAKAAFEKIIDENPQLAFIKEIKPSTLRAQEEVEKILRDMVGPKNSLPVYIKGKRKYLVMSDQMYKAFNNMTPMQMGMVERFLGGIFRTSKKILQFGATSTPDFMIRHFYRAVGTSFLNSKAAPVDFLKHSFVDIPKAVFAVLGKTELYHEWASSSGALSTYMDLSDKGLARMQKEIFSGNDMSKFLNPMKWLKTAKEVSDYAPRIAVFQKAKEKGASDLEAGLLSLEATGNYIRHGSLVKRINQYAPFFNDMVQGGDRFMRSIARDPAGFSMRALATITMPQMLLAGYYLYGADDKTRDEYLNLPEWRRGVSMNIKVGDTWIPVPRAFAPGFVFGALPEKLMIWAYQGDHPEMKHFWLNMLAETATSVSPVFDWTRAINPIVKSMLESVTNYSFFMQRPLFAGDLQKTAPRNQYNQYTSETAKLLGKMFNYSPTDIDNTVYDMSAKIGRFATQLTDVGINAARKASGQPVNEKPTRVTDNPLYGGLIEETPRGTNTASFQEFREHFNDAAQAHNEFKELKGADAGAYQKDNHQLLAAYDQVNHDHTQINKMLKQIRLINSNTNLSGDDKTMQINAVSDQITRLVEGANKRFRTMTKQ